MLCYDDIIGTLTTEFPEFNKLIQDEGEHIVGLPHLFFSIVFVRYLIENFENDNKVILQKAVAFMDKMLTDGDDGTKNLLAVSVVEGIVMERELVKTIKDICSKELYGLITVEEKESGWLL
jgi:hypothetical protein